MNVRDFIEGEYLPHVKATLAASSFDGYRKQFAGYGKYFDGVVLDLRVCDCQAILRRIASENPQLNKTSLRHLKAFFSGAWTHALRMGVIDRDNPWRAVSIPNAPQPGETYAYAPAEIETMLSVLKAPYDLVVLLAAATGLRKSEIRGLQWQDWKPESCTLEVQRAVWRGHVKSTKSKASRAPVPIIPVLADRLTELGTQKKHKGFIFATIEGAPLDLDNVARRIIRPALIGTKTKWAGFHAFRRGLATFLHAQGVDDKTIQAILRHENVSITQQCYIRTVPESVRAAMATVHFGEKNENG